MPGRRLRDRSLGPHLRRRTVRVRLTALYCFLFFPSGVVFALVTFFLLVFAARAKLLKPSVGASHGAGKAQNLAGPTVHIGVLGHQIALGSDEFLLGSCIVLVVMMGVSVLLGWYAAGRVLRPLRVMTTTTRRISERNLHERLALGGPDDELKDLGDTIDGLLARLETAFDSQQRFVANASHEMRTPLMLSQTLLQVALADPDVTLDSLRIACQEAIDAGKDQAQLIDALLTLARSQRGLEHREPVDLRLVVNDALHAHEPSAATKGLQVDATLDHAEVPGDVRLIYRLASNLIDNAIRYNITAGRVEVNLAASTSEATLTVTNAGPPVPPDQVSRLLQPFQRAASDRTAGPNGLGLGLSIVAQIAEAHGASLEVHPRPEGGLIVTVSFLADPSRRRQIGGRAAHGQRTTSTPNPAAHARRP